MTSAISMAVWNMHNGINWHALEKQSMMIRMVVNLLGDLLEVNRYIGQCDKELKGVQEVFKCLVALECGQLGHTGL